MTDLGVDGDELGGGDLLRDLAPVAHVRDERVGVVRHVHAQEPGLLCDGIFRHLDEESVRGVLEGKALVEGNVEEGWGEGWGRS